MMKRSLPSWLEYIESLHHQIMDFDRHRFEMVLNKLALQPSSFVITVAGTNGKGTTVALLEGLFSNLGLRTGVYTSPHLLKFNERIRLNQTDIDDVSLVSAFENIEAARANISLTFFEFTTLAAFLIFKKASPDILILEIGLGGRLDAVNAWSANLAVITSIALDHCDILGTTREAIAREKAGIFRAYTDAVVGDLEPPHTLYEIAQDLQTPLYVINKDFEYKLNDSQFHFKWQAFSIFTKLPHIPYQNVATGIMAFLLAMTKIQTEYTHEKLCTAIQSAVSETKVLGRFTERVIQNRKVIFDVAHNPHAAQYLFNRLQTEVKSKRILAVFGMLKDKDMATVIETMHPLIAKWHLCSLPGERGCSAEHLQTWVKTDNAIYANPAQAFAQSLKESAEDDIILVFGSFLTVAEILCLGVYSIQ